VRAVERYYYVTTCIEKRSPERLEDSASSAGASAINERAAAATASPHTSQSGHNRHSRSSTDRYQFTRIWSAATDSEPAAETAKRHYDEA
jgi:hypothetical protein